MEPVQATGVTDGNQKNRVVKKQMDPLRMKYFELRKLEKKQKTEREVLTCVVDGLNESIERQYCRKRRAMEEWEISDKLYRNVSEKLVLEEIRVATLEEEKNQNAVRLLELIKTATRLANDKHSLQFQCLKLEKKLKNSKTAIATDAKIATVAEAVDDAVAANRTTPEVGRARYRPPLRLRTNATGPKQRKLGGAGSLRLQNDKHIRISILRRARNTILLSFS